MHPLFLSLFFVAISRALARAHGSETVFGAEGDENINVYCSVCKYDPLKNGIHHARYTMFEVYHDGVINHSKIRRYKACGISYLLLIIMEMSHEYRTFIYLHPSQFEGLVRD